MPPLKVTILGAGISGLTASIGLRQQGHHVTLLEKASFVEEAGAAIMLGPNASGLLQRLGMKPETVGANLLLGMALYHGNGDVKMKSPLPVTRRQLYILSCASSRRSPSTTVAWPYSLVITRHQ